jgi:hypothetical protein
MCASHVHQPRQRTNTCIYCRLQVGHEAAEATGGSMATTELAGHTDTVVSLAFNTAGTAGSDIETACLPGSKQLTATQLQAVAAVMSYS